MYAFEFSHPQLTGDWIYRKAVPSQGPQDRNLSGSKRNSSCLRLPFRERCACVQGTQQAKGRLQPWDPHLWIFCPVGWVARFSPNSVLTPWVKKTGCYREKAPSRNSLKERSKVCCHSRSLQGLSEPQNLSHRASNPCCWSPTPKEREQSQETSTKLGQV